MSTGADILRPSSAGRRKLAWRLGRRGDSVDMYALRQYGLVVAADWSGIEFAYVVSGSRGHFPVFTDIPS